jgi:putative transposase
VNHKRLHRIYREAGLMIRRKKRKHCVRVGQPLRVWTAANQEWALDFAHDAVACGRAIRVLSVVDAYTRECLALEVDTSFASRRVTRVLEQIVAERGQPKAIRCDNGPELTSRHFLAWCVERQIDLVHIQPGKSTQNAHVESFHGRLREECLAVSWFQTCSMRGGKSRRGERNTTKSDRTAVWDTGHRESLLLRWPRPSIQLSEG